MSKFIALLCAAAMLSATSCVVFADDTTDEVNSEESYYDEAYSDDVYDEDTYYDDILSSDNETEYYESDAEQYDDVYVDNIAGEIKVIATAPDSEETPDAVMAVVFTDVPEDAYYADAVKFCYERGLFNGMTDTEFAPDLTMTRGMFATVFGRIQNADLTDVALTYEDVNPDAYYASYIAWATKEGIMDGYSEKAFGPDDAITREQAAKMLHAYLKNIKNISITDVAANYFDMDNVSDWASAAINANTSVGYLRIDENNRINPKAELTRADACFAVATTIKLVEALEAEGLKDADENTETEEPIEITAPIVEE